MEVDPAHPAASGVHQVVTTLRRQLDVTRQQVLSLQELKDKKLTLLQTGYSVLEQHCSTASSGPDAQFQTGNLNSNFQAAVTGLAPCSSGWKVSILVDGPSELLNNLDITITATLPGTEIHGCSIKQLEETSFKATATGAAEASAGVSARASALIELQGFPFLLESPALEIYALLTPSLKKSSSQRPGILSAAVHAGRITLERTAWLHALNSSSLNKRRKEHGDNQDEEHISRWQCAAHFFVEIGNNAVHQIGVNWLDTLLNQKLGCFRLADAQWLLGSIAEVHSSLEQYNSTVLPISIYGESMQIVWTLQQELETLLEEKIKVGHQSGTNQLQVSPSSLPPLKLPKWIQRPYSFTTSQQKQQEYRQNSANSINTGIDALVCELESLTTWVEALKKQAAANSILTRQQVLVAQAAAVDAMIHTDSAVIVVERIHSLNV